MKQPIRLTFFRWLRKITEQPENSIPILPLRIIYRILFPIKQLIYSVNKKEGYDWERGIWRIHGMVYSDDIFYHFAYGTDETFKIVKREDGIITIEKQN